MEVGFRLRRIQQGERLGLPHSRPMSRIGKRVHELRVDDDEQRLTWRFIYRADRDQVLVLHSFEKKSQKTSQKDIDLAKKRLKEIDNG